MWRAISPQPCGNLSFGMTVFSTLNNPLSYFQITQNVPIDAGAFKPLARGREPDAQDGAKKAEEDRGGVIGVTIRDGQLRRQAVDNTDGEDEQRGEQVAGMAEIAEVKGPAGGENVAAAAEKKEELGGGEREVLDFGLSKSWFCQVLKQEAEEVLFSSCVGRFSAR